MGGTYIKYGTSRKEGVNKIYKRLMLMIAVLALLIYFWDSYRSHTFEYATVLRIDSHEMTVINLEQRQRTIRTKVDLTKMVLPNESYFVSYNKRLFDYHRLKRISPG